MSTEEIPQFNKGAEVSIARGPGAYFENGTRELLEAAQHVDDDLATALAGLETAMGVMDRTAPIDEEAAQAIEDTAATMAAAARLATSSELETTYPA